LLILVVSLVVLASASHFAIKSIERLIELTGLSEASAGFIILAVMTSTPESFQLTRDFLIYRKFCSNLQIEHRRGFVNSV